MISKHLVVAAAILLMSGFGASQAFAQASNQAAPAAPAMTAPGAPAAPGADQSAAPGATAPAAATPAPAPAAPPPPAPAPAAKTGPQVNPYGLSQLWANGDFVIRGVLVLLGLMSIGTWYIFFMKFFEQSRMLSQASQVEKRFWASNNLNEGIDKLAKNSVFRTVAESGVRASSGQGGGIVNLNDWIGMSLNRQLDEINSKLNGGIAFLASVGSTSPFVGLFGTVWGILNALISIGVAGQASIDKVAGPVGEALISTALGLAVAVPAVLLYNFLVRRNKVINEKLRSFASDLQTYLVTKGK
jgi:biopolymer transport protein ExbB